MRFTDTPSVLRMIATRKASRYISRYSQKLAAMLVRFLPSSFSHVYFYQSREYKISHYFVLFHTTRCLIIQCNEIFILDKKRKKSVIYVSITRGI